MSNVFFPTLPGLAIEVAQEPEFKTGIQASPTGKELRVGNRVYPIWNKTLRFNFLRDTTAFPELKSLIGFYLSRLGPLDSFLFIDDDDGAVTAQAIGTGNGANRNFQLVRSYGGFVEPIFNPVAITALVNGTSQPYTHLGNGVIQYTTAPGAGAACTWTGTYAFRCRFNEDRINVQKFLWQVWSANSVKLVASLQDKI